MIQLRAAAHRFLTTYPTPRALRASVRERNIHDILREYEEVLGCPYVADDGQGERRETLGYWLRHGGLDLNQIHAAIQAGARTA